ncbi:MAG TPA: universal stress protein [Terriglobia bacterium]|nr:universal stress protein [Terriglobia bacterium]
MTTFITNVLFPVDFSASCVAMAPYVKRAATLFGAKVSLIHVFDPASYNGFELYIRKSLPEIAEDHEEIARNKLDSFLRAEFPPSEHPRILLAGDAAAKIAEIARGGFDLIIMPTHAGTFRQMLFGSTTAKVLNDADCPVLTSHHAPTIAPRPLAHREMLCALGMDKDSERVLRFAHQAALKARCNLHIIHAIQAAGRDLTIQLDLEEEVQSQERKRAAERIANLQSRVGSNASVRIIVGPIKEALLDAARGFDADALIIGGRPQSTVNGGLRDLTYAIVRDSPFPVLSV